MCLLLKNHLQVSHSRIANVLDIRQFVIPVEGQINLTMSADGVVKAVFVQQSNLQFGLIC
jgi:hypothetical protein